MLIAKLESEADDFLRALAGLETYDVNLSSHPKAWEALEVFARAIEALVRAECVPPGHVVVPEEATDAMIDATYHGQPLATIWSDMLAAATGITAPQGEQQ